MGLPPNRVDGPTGVASHPGPRASVGTVIRRSRVGRARMGNIRQTYHQARRHRIGPQLSRIIHRRFLREQEEGPRTHRPDRDGRWQAHGHLQEARQPHRRLHRAIREASTRDLSRLSAPRLRHGPGNPSAPIRSHSIDVPHSTRYRRRNRADAPGTSSVEDSESFLQVHDLDRGRRLPYDNRMGVRRETGSHDRDAEIRRRAVHRTRNVSVSTSTSRSVALGWTTRPRLVATAAIPTVPKPATVPCRAGTLTPGRSAGPHRRRNPGARSRRSRSRARCSRRR